MSDHPTRKMKEMVKNGCACGGNHGHYSVTGPFCKWLCHVCNRETKVEWD